MQACVYYLIFNMDYIIQKDCSVFSTSGDINPYVRGVNAGTVFSDMFSEKVRYNVIILLLLLLLLHRTYKALFLYIKACSKALHTINRIITDSKTKHTNDNMIEQFNIRED